MTTRFLRPLFLSLAFSSQSRKDAAALGKEPQLQQATTAWQAFLFPCFVKVTGLKEALLLKRNRGLFGLKKLARVLCVAVDIFDFELTEAEMATLAAI